MTTFSEIEHRHNNPAARFECVLINKSIIYVTMHKQNAPKRSKLRVTDVSEEPVRKHVIYSAKHKQKTAIYKLSRSKHQNTENLGLQTYEKN